MNRSELISELSITPRPRSSLLPINTRLILWLVGSLIFITLTLILTGEFRPGFLLQFKSSSRFFFETLLGLLSILFCTASGFYSTIPGANRNKWGVTYLGFLFGFLFILSLIYGLWHPSLEPSMVGKRHLCVIETFLYGIPPGILILFLAWRAYPLQPLKTSLILGFAASLPGAVFMQIACMYDPAHNLKFHIAPALLLWLVLTITGNQILKKLK